MTRQATEVLLSVERTVNELLKYARNQDMLIKTLVNRITILENSNQPVITVPAKVPQEPPPKAQMPGLKPGVVLKKVKQDQEHYQFTEYKEGQQPVQVLVKHGNEEEGPRGKSRAAPREASTSSAGVPVQQKVLDANGKSVTSASVEIFAKAPDGSFNLIKSSKTNATGKWTNALQPGNYVVKVFKKGTNQRPAVELAEPIIVPNSAEPVQLRPIQVK